MFELVTKPVDEEVDKAEAAATEAAKSPDFFMVFGGWEILVESWKRFSQKNERENVEMMTKLGKVRGWRDYIYKERWPGQVSVWIFTRQLYYPTFLA